MTTSLHVFENHDEAYHIWRRAGLTGKTLVHLDAHHDMAWLKSANELHIGNYVCQAMKDGIVAEVFWIVPDPTWTSAASRKYLCRVVNRLTKTYSTTRSRVRIGADRMTTSLMDLPVTIGPMASLPCRAADVLLDIDTDFMLIPIVSSLVSDADVEGPWIWPDEVASRVRAAGIAPAVTTIAYSVDGGYTSLHWKYLGAALAAELEAPSHETARVRSGFGYLREAAAAASLGDLDSAEIACKRAQAGLPQDAAPVYNLARWYAKAKRLPEARALYDAARDLDASYATPYNNRGPWYLYEHQEADAEREYAFALDLNPTDPYAQFGLAQVAFARKQWRDAEALLRRALAAKADFIDATRLLGDVLAELGSDEEAAAAYRQSLRLALSGVMPLRQPNVSAASMIGPRDRDHGTIHARLARLDEKHERLAEATAGYRMAIAARDTLALRLRLARIYAKQGRWWSAGREAIAALKHVPAEARTAPRACGAAIRSRLGSTT